MKKHLELLGNKLELLSKIQHAVTTNTAMIQEAIVVGTNEMI